MDAATWKGIWFVVFVAASAMFYGTVLVVTVGGMGDFVRMIREMLAARRKPSP